MTSPRKPARNRVSDRERILFAIACHSPSYDYRRDEGDVRGTPVRWVSRPAKKGEIVRCMSSIWEPRRHHWTIARVVEVVSANELVVREIGGPRTCHVSNEAFHVLVGIPAGELTEGRQRRAVERIRAGFRKIGSVDGCILVDVHFATEEARDAVVTFRANRVWFPDQPNVDLVVGISPLPSAGAIAQRIRAAAPWVSTSG